MTQTILRALDTNHRTTTAYHPQANGQVERLNHTLADMLSMYVSSDHTDWDETLPFVTFAYNTSRQESTGRTPFFLLHGREAALPTDIALGVELNSGGIDAISTEDYAFQLQRSMTKAKKEVKDRLQVVQHRQSRYYNRKRRDWPQYQPGDRVLVYKPTRKVGRSEKLLHRWHGPYDVVQKSSPLNYVVHNPRHRNSLRNEVVHVERLKPFVDLPRSTQQDKPNPSSDPDCSTSISNVGNGLVAPHQLCFLTMWKIV